MSNSKSILKSTGLIGGSSVINLFFNILRSKVVAVILGPSGTGLIGALQSSIMLVKTLSGLGVQNSAVRNIAQANAKNNIEDLSKTVKSLRRLVIFTGLAGLVLVLILAKPLSIFTFDTTDYIFEIRLLSIAVFFNLISAGQGALIQGMRRIKDIAKISIIGAALSSILSIPLIYFYEMDGIAIYLVMLAIGQYIVTFYFARKIKTKDVNLSWAEFLENAKSMISLGLSFMGGNLTTLGTAFLIKVIIIRDFQLSGSGLYQAAMALSGLYINVVLQAMAKDFYPRLTEVSFQSDKEIKLINEQTEIGMYLAAPGLLFTLAIAPYAIELLYSAEYLEAYSLLQWMIIGIFLRTISWPMGYLYIARAKTKMFFLVQVISNIIHLGLLFLFTNYFGLLGAGIAFCSLYVSHVFYMYILIRKENNYRWTLSNIKSIIGLMALFLISFIILLFTKQWVGSLIISILAMIVGYYTLKKIMTIMEVSSFNNLLKLFKNKIRK